LSPWLGRPFLDLVAPTRGYTLITDDRLWMIAEFVRHCAPLEGAFVECGVYKGGSLRLIAAAANRRPLGFDTFTGMPRSDPARDVHQAGDFADTSLAAVAAYLNGRAELVAGFIPTTFAHLPEQIAFAHIDVDLHSSVLACCEGLVPRLVSGGVVLFDDYAQASTPGARDAIEEYFGNDFIALQTGQALVVQR
jgi:O-methyltransferase